MINSISKTGWFLVAAVFFQFCVLVGMVGVSAMPLWTGEEIRVKTVPVDPRSLFRGNYARLNYTFSNFETAKRDPEPAKKGGIVYVLLKRASSGDLYEYADWSLEKPQEGIFIRGRVARYWCSTKCKMRLKFGIEAYFAPKEKALALERGLRVASTDGGVAVLKISKGGKARLKEVLIEPAES